MYLWYLDKSKTSHISFLNLRYKRKVLIIIIFVYILYIRHDTNSPLRTNSFKIPFPYFLFPQHPNNGFPIVLGWSSGHFSLLSLFQRVHVVPILILHSPCHPWALLKENNPLIIGQLNKNWPCDTVCVLGKKQHIPEWDLLIESLI